MIIKFFGGICILIVQLAMVKEDLENAIKRASQQLDFCSVTGHAFWPDIDSLTKDNKDIKNYHLTRIY